MRNGFETASLNRIIDVAQMPKSSFYHYFTDKRDLHERLLETLTATIAEYVRPPDLSTLDAQTFWPALRGLLSDLERMVQAHPETIALARLFYALDGADEAATRLRTRAWKWANTTLARGVELGVVRADLPLSLLTALAIAAFTAIDRWALDVAEPPEAATYVERGVEALRRLLEGN